MPTPASQDEVSLNQGSIDEQIARAMSRKSSADGWITVTCWLTGVVCVVAAPFTFGLSLLAFLGVAPIAAVGCISTESKRQTELLKLIVRKVS
jgi:hypothetical protein